MTNKENHHRMWTYLHENPEKEKHDWPEWKTNGGSIKPGVFYCFACEEDGGVDADCRKCPINWCDEEPSSSREMQCVDNNTVFYDWTYYKKLGITLEERAALALQIRDMWK